MLLSEKGCQVKVGLSALDSHSDSDFLFSSFCSAGGSHWIFHRVGAVSNGSGDFLSVMSAAGWHKDHQAT